MKTYRDLIWVLLLTVSLNTFGDDTSKDPNDLGTVVTPIKTYEHVHLKEVTDLGIKCTWDGGLGLISFDLLTPELQKRFNYDPAKFKQATIQQSAHDAQSDALTIQAAKTLKAQEEYQKNSVTPYQEKTKPVTKRVWYLVGQVIQSIDDAYVVRLAKYQPPVHVPTKKESGGVTYATAPKDPYLRVGYDKTVILKTNQFLQTGQTVQVSVTEAGDFKSSEGAHYSMFIEYSSQ